ncbi:adenylate/guanylate cyclase domain-containing response regulator [Treponema brennaborense]|uniref:Adenylate/guanylate cyclase n=1 Tax=Treponema brennaborense (strain DSM 12168 / CIP 105900 / DD5/3) TaxID=906968 RepID=F4LNS9_TREBD|nr:adenylate/guanylate cyclase domain-containing response regulator [Treponema brennaborense]AEE16914.1 adenylate/guanylate cyclase [Treponema brennaborense DSM 12168]
MDKKIVLAETSALLTQLISSRLKDESFDVMCFDDGKDAGMYILDNNVDCILSDVRLKTISGTQLCCIVKNYFERNSVPFILFSTDSADNDFWTKHSGANHIVTLERNSVENLVLALRESFSVKPPAEENVAVEAFKRNEAAALHSARCETDLTLTVINEIERSRHYYLLLNSILGLSPFVHDTDVLVKEIFKTIRSLCTFDAIALFLNDEPLCFYHTGIDHFAVTENSFYKICEKDFQSCSGNLAGFSCRTKEISDGAEVSDGKDFNSYLHFPIDGASFIGTLHIASKRSAFFTDKESSSLEYLCRNLGFVLEEAVRFRKSHLVESRLRSAFSKFVPAEIIDDLIKADNTEKKASNEKRKVAILICDIRNFTNISEVNQPESVVDFLNGYFTRMVSIIKKHGGSIDKFIGDAIMAIFGAPVSYVDNASRAADAALEMISVLPEISLSSLELPAGVKFDVGIGVHYGEVIVGNIGCEDKIDYTVIGDSVNLASRLEGLTKQYGVKIILSEAAKENLRAGYNLMQVDTVKVKGKNQGVRIYRSDLQPLNDAYVQVYEKGLSMYMNGAFSLALSYFEEALRHSPEDKSACLMKQRCVEFMEKKPENWDGAIALTSK